MTTIEAMRTAAAVVLTLGAAGVATADVAVRSGDLSSGGESWGRYELSASDPVSGLARMGSHHARQWSSNPANPTVRFDISAHANDWDIEEMGLEIKADYVPGYYVGVRVCARSYGNVGGADGADDELIMTGASTSPQTQLGTFDPSGAGTCKTVNVYTPVEAGADEYTIMVRPLLQMVQVYWGYEIYGKVIVQYYPILD